MGRGRKEVGARMQIAKWFQSGFSLTEVMVAVGLLGGVSLMTMKLVEEQSKREAEMKAKGEITKALALIQSALSDRENCRVALGGNPVTGSLPQLRLEKTINGRTSVLNLLERGKNYQGFSVRASDPAAISLRPTSVTSVSGETQIELMLKFAIGIEPPSKDITRTIPLLVQVVGGNIVSCGAVMTATNLESMQKMCATLGTMATWSVAESRCILNKMACPWGRVPVRLNLLGAMDCVPAQQQIRVEDLFYINDPANCPGGGNNRFRLAARFGKLKLECY
jgi:prepilin-type N-terminal cleavage/methylation domain-containing protein